MVVAGAAVIFTRRMIGSFFVYPKAYRITCTAQGAWRTTLPAVEPRK